MKTSKTCLLIDDDSDDQEIFVTAMQDVSSNTVCLVASDADEAMTMLQDKKNRPDYIFLDLNLPRVNGFQFLRTTKNDPDLQSIPVIIYSTTSEHTHIVMTRELGAAGFYTKPVQYSEICDMLKKYFPPS